METNYKLISQTKNYIKLQLGDEPEVFHLINSGYDKQWFRFQEDGYELEPWQSGIDMITEEMIKTNYGINVNTPNQYIEEQLSKIHSHAEIVNDENPDEVVYREADILKLLKKIV
jgi:hypothetical protein